MSIRTVVFPDLHGDLTALEIMLKLAQVGESPPEHIFLLGDYVDDSFNNRDILDKLCHLQHQYASTHFVYLAGNHDVALVALLGQLRQATTITEFEAAFRRYFITLGYGDGIIQEALCSLKSQQEIAISEDILQYPLELSARESAWKVFADRDDRVRLLVDWIFKHYIENSQRFEFFKNMNLLHLANRLLYIHGFPDLNLLEMLLDHGPEYVNALFRSSIVAALAGDETGLGQFISLQENANTGESPAPLNFYFERLWPDISKKTRDKYAALFSMLGIKACIHGHTHTEQQEAQINRVESTMVVNLALGGVVAIRNHGLSIFPNCLEVVSNGDLQVSHCTMTGKTPINLYC